jgi:TonB-linked SusC/RagA family outer membrane protein
MKHIYILRIATVASLLISLPGAVFGQTENDRLNMGYISQSYDSVTGAVSVVSGSELEKSPVSNLSQSFVGRLSGLVTMESNGMPGRTGTVSSYVRGLATVNGNSPLIILDGVICSLESIDYITPQEVESVCVLKDASLTAIYGVEGGNGAIVVNTKRGRNESLRVMATFDQLFQQMTRRPTFIESWQYAEMKNQAWSNDGATGAAPYTQEQIEAFRNGSNRNLYPNNDWYGMMFRPWALSQKASITTTGGNDKIRMFSNINFAHQGGQFIHDGATLQSGNVKYDPKAESSYRVNFRTNLDFNITKRLSGYLRLNGNVSKENAAGNTYGSSIENSHRMIYSSLFMLPPTLYGPYTPLTGDLDNPGGNIITNEYVDNPPYGMLNRSGYGKYTSTNIMAQAGLKLDMDFITKGLNLTGMFAYETNSSGYQHIGAQFQRWVRDNNPSALEFTQIGVGTWDELPLDHTGAAGLGYKLSLFSYRMHANARLEYDRRFGQSEVSAMAYGYYQNYISPNTDSTHAFPYNRVATGVSASWMYDKRYYLKLDAAYSGSEEFARDHRFTLTPSLSAGWVISEENFMPKGGALTTLKLRASAGIVANDRIGDGRFMYTSNYINGGSRYVETLGYMITENMIGNPALAPEKIVKQNYGLDLELFNSLSLSVDYFRSLNTNMLVNRVSKMPSFAGVSSGITAPVNEGRMQNNGIEVTLAYIKAINDDVDIWANGNFLYAKNTITQHLELPMGEGYAYQYRTQGYSVGQMFGYLIDRSTGDGYFTSQEQIDAVYYSFGTPRLGDFRYRNLNGDKTADGRDIIDEKDLAPIGYPSVPQISFGAGFGFRWKGLEFSMLLQGAARSSRAFYNAMGFNESLYGGVYSDIHLDAWTPERAAAGEKISFPALSAGSSVSRQPNDFFIMNTSYIRVKNLEICYSLPESVLRPIRAQQVKFVVSANNLLTIDWLPGKSVDPEIASLAEFQNYRTFNIGVRLAF